jgi:Antidote-toxin recognition MazE, bacterial antitoxin
MHVQRIGKDLVIVVPPDVARRHNLRGGDEVVVFKATTTEHDAFEQALEQVLRDHAPTFEYLRDK